MKESKPRILLFDLETSPNLGYSWGRWEQNIIEFKEEWQILSVAYKWLNEKQTLCKSIKDFNSKNDKELTKHLWRLFQEADIIIAHNGKAFDIKKAKARFVFWKLKPCKRLSVIDTKQVAKNGFGFNSNSLDDLGNHLGVGRKIKHEGFGLWLKCMSGDAKAFCRLKKYNVQDVVLLEKVYKRLKPWILDHPSLSSIAHRTGCPNCGSAHVVKYGLRANHAGVRQQMLCKACGAWYLTRYRKAK